MTQPPYSLDLCDAELRRLSSAAAAIALTLVELESDPTRRLLAAGTLCGETTRVWTEVQDRTRRLWSGHQTLTDFVARAGSVRGAGRRLGRDETVQLSTLLFTDSIALSSAQVALTERRLLGPTVHTTWSSPSALLADLESAFDTVRDALQRVSTAWQWQLPRISAREAELRSLRAKDSTSSAAVARSATALSALVDKVGADPLGVSYRDFEVVEELLGQARAAVSSAAELAARLAEIRSHAESLLEDISAVHGEAVSAHALAADKILGFQRPVPTAPDAGLADELAALGSGAHMGSSAAGARLLAWQSRAKFAYDQAVAERDAANQPMRERAELRGRLEAYRAKAHRYGLAESTQLSRMAGRAHDLLHTAPCDLEAARSALAAYVAAVTSSTAPTDIEPSDAVRGGQ